LWQERPRSRFDETIQLQVNNDLPELLDALYARNSSWPALASKRQTQRQRQARNGRNDDDLYVATNGNATAQDKQGDEWRDEDGGAEITVGR
jgi:hypothetical protein